MLGSSFWNEPQYYGSPSDDAADAALGLSAESSLVLSTAREIARGPNPRDLLALALWAREQGGRRIPVYFIGVGEKLEDLQTFDAAEFAQALLS